MKSYTVSNITKGCLNCFTFIQTVSVKLLFWTPRSAPTGSLTPGTTTSSKAGTSAGPRISAAAPRTTSRKSFFRTASVQSLRTWPTRRTSQQPPDVKFWFSTASFRQRGDPTCSDVCGTCESISRTPAGFRCAPLSCLIPAWGLKMTLFSRL